MHQQYTCAHSFTLLMSTAFVLSKVYLCFFVVCIIVRTQSSVTLIITLLLGKKCLNMLWIVLIWCLSLYAGILFNHCLVLLSYYYSSPAPLLKRGLDAHVCAHTQTHTCTSLSQKEQALSLSSLTAWLLILLPKYHKTGYNIYNYPHLH